MEEYPSNSHKTKPVVTRKDSVEAADNKRVVKPVTNTAVKRKRPLGRRFLDVFVGNGDDARGIWAYIRDDVIIPMTKDMISDVVTGSVERAVYGDGRSSRSRTRGSESGRYSSSYTPYRRAGAIVSRNDRDDPRDISDRARRSHDFGEIVLEQKVEAEEVLDRLNDLCSQFGLATVQDLYELVGMRATHADANWGWSSMEGSDIVRLRSGYLLDLPRTKPID